MTGALLPLLVAVVFCAVTSALVFRGVRVRQARNLIAFGAVVIDVNPEGVPARERSRRVPLDDIIDRAGDLAAKDDAVVIIGRHLRAVRAAYRLRALGFRHVTAVAALRG